jgi:hypothetical protein
MTCWGGSMKFKLVVKKDNLVEQIDVRITSDGVTKTEASLQEIDLFLLCGLGHGFKNKSELFYTLNNLGEELSLEDDVFISYNNKGLKKAEALFGYSPIVNYAAYISNETEKAYKETKKIKNEEIYSMEQKKAASRYLNDPIIKDIINGFYEGILKYKYRELISNMKFSKRYLDAISTYSNLETTYNEEQKIAKSIAKEQLDRMLRNYKNLRRIIMATKDYNKKYDASLGADPRQAEFELERIKEMLNKEETIYDLAKTYSKKDPDIIASVGINPFAGGVNPYDDYPLEDLPYILTKETAEDSLEEYQGRQNIKQ